MVLNIILYALLGTSFVFAIVELGLSAFVVSAVEHTEYDTWGGYVKVKAPAIVGFMVFASLWTMLIAVAALVLPWYYTRKGSVTPKLNTVLAASFVAGYFVTMVFWLAAFADLATYLDYVSNEYYNAMIAFAVLLWFVSRVLVYVTMLIYNPIYRILFIALLVFTILAMCGVMNSEWAGYRPVRNKANAPVEPAHDLPMSTYSVTSRHTVMLKSNITSRTTDCLVYYCLSTLPVLSRTAKLTYLSMSSASPGPGGSQSSFSVKPDGIVGRRYNDERSWWSSCISQPNIYCEFNQQLNYFRTNFRISHVYNLYVIHT
ncbi:unnamed protein product [Penicillium salamii]|uniref:MARVEL domain-containing protein n=1 Tax=Penicillium salamii TaxID=1612424 RepID=A0A9W4NTH2_9EURO|nr:unnamed protein product [Penicillium salamii]CAG8264699.1 unnamed protein product [Penicillium salamii]CAG8337406.1 unnamed protein product [Penicillium salamii]CAG8341605.1 unnamed protein product [Penicillium salamii]CAG8342106.1 unnamed protein product [Penicillium salamii]